MERVEQRALNSSVEAVVLRYGMFFGPGTWYWADGDVGRQVFARRFPMIGDGEGIFSFIHIYDTATATARALDAPPGVYNVVDDDPAPMATRLPAFASALNTRTPMRVPHWLARIAAGKAMVTWMTALKGADNRKAKTQLGWKLTYSSWRQGFRQEA